MEEGYEYEVYNDGPAGWAWIARYEGRVIVMSTNHKSEDDARADCKVFDDNLAKCKGCGGCTRANCFDCCFCPKQKHSPAAEQKQSGPPVFQLAKDLGAWDLSIVLYPSGPSLEVVNTARRIDRLAFSMRLKSINELAEKMK